jgi:hypothetical protein
VAFFKRPRLKVPKESKHLNKFCWVHKLELVLFRKKPDDKHNYYRFDSLKEGNRFIELVQLQRHGFISQLSKQVCYPLVVNEQIIGKMRLDFVYKDETTGEYIIEDVKGKATPLWLWKAKHFEAQFGKKITIS